jgi:hypothetical protein
MGQKHSMTGILIKVALCFCAVPLLRFWLIIFIQFNYYVQEQQGSFWLLLTSSFPPLYQTRWYWCSVIPLIFYFLAGILIVHLSYAIKHFPGKLAIILILTLIGIDQVAQFIMVKNHETIHLVVIDEWLTISPIPVINDDYISTPKALNDRFDLIIYLVGILFFYFEYRLFYFFLPKQRALVAMSAILFFAGMFGSCFNWLVYDNGYDYIKIEHLMVFDIKDIYLELGMFSGFLLFTESMPSLKKYKKMSSLYPKIVEYLKWERSTWCNIVGKQKMFLQTHLGMKKGE